MHSPRTRAGRIAVFGGVAALGVLGCGGNVTTAFPPGLSPFDMTNTAPLPTPTATDAYPETLTFARTTYFSPVSMRTINSEHARAYIQASPAATWAAARDPQTGRDPVHADGFAVLAYADDPMYQYSFRTHVVVHNIATVEWDVEWRHGVVEGTDAAPTVTATRWQKTAGADAITVLEGSLVLRAVAGQPNVTAVEYQYHLQAAFSGYDTIEGYLSTVFQRLRDRAHGVALNPNDCVGCPTPPAGY
jgi:hypothetical protein